MKVETKSASLDTLSVTIQALHVSGKQMTLAVFRQLPSCRAYDIKGDINSELQPWGIVRYRIADEGSLWLVASRKGELYRANLFDLNYDALDEKLKCHRRGGFRMTDMERESLEADVKAADRQALARSKMLELPQLFISV